MTNRSETELGEAKSRKAGTKVKNRQINFTMKSPKILLAAILLFSGQLLFGQQSKNPWEKWNFLIGEWVGEGNGQPGQGEGKFSFQTDLDGKAFKVK